MQRWAWVLAVLAIGSLISVSPAFAAQMEANLNPDAGTSSINIKYQKSVFVNYEEGGQVADMLRPIEWETTISADSSDPGVQDLMNRINQKIAAESLGTTISDLTVNYIVRANGGPLLTAIDYKVEFDLVLNDYIIREREGQNPALVDMGWRGISVTGPVTIKGVEINQMISPIKDNEPQLYQLIKGSEAESLLSQNLINAERIKTQQLGNWHFLFDPTGIGVDAAQFGLSEEIAGFVISGFTMGESSIREGRQVEQEQEATFTADKPYVIRAVQAADNAQLRIIGFANIDSLDGVEIVGVTPTPPEGFATTSSGDFPVMIIYGMAGLAAVGGGAFFVFSNRKLKSEEGKQGQQGIDPSQLRSYQTSAGAGGYQTVRGEAQLASDTEYQKTRSVYDETSADTSTQQTEDTPKKSKGSMPKGWKPE